jgi:predicted RNA methylase
MKIENDILAVLDQAETSGTSLVLARQLDRKIYLRANKVLEAAGGKWNRKAKAHIFKTDAADRIDEIILSGEVEIPKDEFDFFPTPPDVVARLLELADIQNGMSVLEPSAGTGAIALEMAKITGPLVDCFEISKKNVDILYGYPQLGIVCQLDFLEAHPISRKTLCGKLYDRVVMNPPFTKQADIRHVTHALTFLKPDGLLVSVMAAGVTFRENKLTKTFCALLDQRKGSMETLPDGAFRESGTMVSSVIVTIPGASREIE